MSNLIVNKDEVEYTLLNEEILLLVFHMDLLMFRIKRFDDSINNLIKEDKDTTLILEELKDSTIAFQDVARKLESNLVRFRELERELGSPVNLNYIILLKALRISKRNFMA